MTPPFTKKGDVVVGVDFGTTTTVVSFACAGAQDVIKDIIEWPGGSQGGQKAAVPTEIRYEGGKTQWGFQIEPDKPRYQRFKLALNKQRGYERSHVSVAYPDKREVSPDADKNAAELTTDFLKKVYNQIQVSLERAYGRGLLNTTPTHYMLTVPAIWSQNAKDLTMDCAKAAGFGNNVHPIIEPEAAVTHAITVLPGQLNTGDTFVCCDAGGGTVDLISYEIDEINSGGLVKISETVNGEGSLCGSTFINNKFKDFFIKRFGDAEGYDSRELKEAMDDFEHLKCNFTGEGGNFYIKVCGLVDDPERNIKRGRISFTLADMKSFFEEVVMLTTALVKAQIKLNKNPVSKVLLVGGFGQSEYLKRRIQEVVGPAIEVIQPPGGWEAIARGAVIQGFARTSSKPTRVAPVRTRIARKWYGVSSEHTYERYKQNKLRRRWDDYAAEHRVEVVDWFINRGNKLDEKKPVTRSYFETRLVADGKFGMVVNEIWVYEGSKQRAPKYTDECRVHVRLHSDLSPIPQRKQPGGDGKVYYRIDYDIRATFLGASTEFSLWHDDQHYGTVRAEYQDEGDT